MVVLYWPHTINQPPCTYSEATSSYAGIYSAGVGLSEEWPFQLGTTKKKNHMVIPDWTGTKEFVPPSTTVSIEPGS